MLLNVHISQHNLQIECYVSQHPVTKHITKNTLQSLSDLCGKEALDDDRVEQESPDLNLHV